MSGSGTKKFYLCLPYFFKKKKEKGIQVIILLITKPSDLITENKGFINKELRYFQK